MSDPLPFAGGPDGPYCSHCGHLLRGVRSPFCVECGQPRQRRIAYFDRAEFDAVRAALDLAGVPYDFHDPRVGIIGMLTLLDGVNLQPVIVIEWRHLPAAERALDDAEMALPVALVDEAEPFCPCCGFVLQRDGASGGRCDVCGTRYAWYDGTAEPPHHLSISDGDDEDGPG